MPSKGFVNGECRVCGFTLCATSITMITILMFVACVFVHAYIIMYIYIHICIYIYICRYVCICIYTYILIYIYTRTHARVSVHRNGWLFFVSYMYIFMRALNTPRLLVKLKGCMGNPAPYNT